MTPPVTVASDTPDAAGAPLPRRSPFDRDWRKALVVELTLLVALALAWVLWQLVSPFLRTVVLFTLAAVLAFTLATPVDTVSRRVGSRLLAIALVYLALGALLVGGLVLLAGPFVGQATALAADLPRYADDVQSWTPQLQSYLGAYGIRADFLDLKTRAAATVEQGGGDLLRHLVAALTEVGVVILDVVLALVVSFYLLLDGPSIRVRLLSLLPPEHRGKGLFLEDRVTRVLGGYLRGQLTLALIVGAAAGLGAWLFGLPYAVVLGVLAGLFELVPMFGPILSALPAALIALFMPFPTVLWVILFFFVVQQVESNVLVPRISGHAVGLHPLGALFALLVGFQAAGVLGGLFAVPIAGILWVLVGAAYRHTVERPTRPGRWPIPPFRRPTAPPPTSTPRAA